MENQRLINKLKQNMLILAAVPIISIGKWVPGRNLFLEMLERRMAAVLKPG